MTKRQSSIVSPGDACVGRGEVAVAGGADGDARHGLEALLRGGKRGGA